MSLGESLEKSLSKQDAIHLLELMNLSLYCEDKNQIINLINKLAYIISFDFAICALGELNENALSKFSEIVNISYPETWVSIYLNKKYYRVDPVIKENFTKFNLQYWADTYKKIPSPKDLLSMKEDFGLKRGYSFGLRDPRWLGGSLFSLSGQYLEHHIRTETILTYIIPFLHQTLVRVLGHPVQKVSALSPKEIEILNWIKLGKTNWDISITLKVSERTVKSYVSNIMKKLNATNRAQAVAIAIAQGLIEIE
jgi:DNA-binding CsgD family transcriptional regulator